MAGVLSRYTKRTTSSVISEFSSLGIESALTFGIVCAISISSAVASGVFQRSLVCKTYISVKRDSASVRGMIPHILGGASKLSSLNRWVKSHGSFCIESLSNFLHCVLSLSCNAAKARDGVVCDAA